MLKLSQVTVAPENKNGVWVKFAEGTEFLIASVTRPEFNKALVAARKDYTKFELEKPENATAIYSAAVQSACLLNWRGVGEEDGVTEIPFTPENVARIMAVPVLRDFIVQSANDITLFNAEAVAEDAGRLKSGDGVGS